MIAKGVFTISALLAELEQQACTLLPEARAQLAEVFLESLHGLTKVIEDAAARALAFPLSGTPSASYTRRVFLKGFPFSLFYRPEDSGIVIFATAHHARKPRYWVGRIRGR